MTFAQDHHNQVAPQSSRHASTPEAVIILPRVQAIRRILGVTKSSLRDFGALPTTGSRMAKNTLWIAREAQYDWRRPALLPQNPGVMYQFVGDQAAAMSRQVDAAERVIPLRQCCGACPANIIASVSGTDEVTKSIEACDASLELNLSAPVNGHGYVVPLPAVAIECEDGRHRRPDPRRRRPQGKVSHLANETVETTSTTMRWPTDPSRFQSSITSVTSMSQDVVVPFVGASRGLRSHPRDRIRNLQQH